MQSVSESASSALLPALPAPVRQWLKPVEPAMRRYLVPPRLSESVERALRGAGAVPFHRRMLDSLDVRYDAIPDSRERIPSSGAAVVVANHPFGMLEGLILNDMLVRVRTDFRILANSLLLSIPEAADRIIPVNPFGGRGAAQSNAAGMRQAIAWLRAGGLLAVFPAGEVSHLNWKERPVADPDWSTSAARLVRMVRCPVVPVFFEGRNSAAFQLGGTLHPGLRTINLMRELDNKRGARITVRVGKPAQVPELDAAGDDVLATAYLRYRTYLLGAASRQPAAGRSRGKSASSIAEPAPQAAIEGEVARLPVLCGNAEFDVHLARASAIPAALHEIGRLREITFRAVGEGVGRAVDLDTFDATYQHLFLWSKARRELVGAYRLCATADILPAHGVQGLYTNTLFRFHASLFDRLGGALELGRSFIRPEYQKQFAPLLLLWKGIARYAASRPECPFLFGAVSISNDYSRASRELLVGFLDSVRHRELAPLVKARHGFRRAPVMPWHVRETGRLVHDVEQLSGPISDLEGDGKGVPVLIRQYLKWGGRTLGVNVDPGFSNVADAMMLVDLRQAPSAMLDRYMGSDLAARYREYHGIRETRDCVVGGGCLRSAGRGQSRK